MKSHLETKADDLRAVTDLAQLEHRQIIQKDCWKILCHIRTQFPRFGVGG